MTSGRRSDWCPGGRCRRRPRGARRARCARSAATTAGTRRGGRRPRRALTSRRGLRLAAARGHAAGRGRGWCPRK
ncbi:MAG: hypothetical protein EPO65_10385 [Dehalococcoidia bacterium]|nr:MAG: hypothetical protein EPO65_10385 [Dehalococcoidia bacterium]